MGRPIRYLNPTWVAYLVYFAGLVSPASFSAAALTAVDINPVNASISVGQTLSFEATGTFSDGSTGILNASVSAIAAGGEHTCALRSNGTAECWGSNQYGQLGNGLTTDSLLPVTVAGVGSTAVAITAGQFHTCALLSNRTVQCWGANAAGQLGNGTVSTASATPVTVSGIGNATAITAGRSHTCALLLDGSVQCWGSSSGNGMPNYSTIPVTVAGLANTAVAVTAGSFHTCALLLDGSAQCWGRNVDGQLGDGTSIETYTPVTVTGVSDAVAIAAGGGHTCALLSDGSMQCWGNNDRGQLGNGIISQFPQTTITTVSGLGGATAIAMGENHTCAVLSDKSARCWGLNFNGQLGNGMTADLAIPETVSNLGGTVTAIAGGSNHNCALLMDGSVQCWGNNESGQIGIGETARFSTPVTVTDISGALAVSAGGAHTCVLDADGTVQCMGYNLYGQLGNGTNTDSVTSLAATVSGLGDATAIAAGGNHSCALLSNGSVQCWGSNENAELGTGEVSGPGSCQSTFADEYECSTTPVTVSGLSGATAIAAGATCALLSNGTAQCWGTQPGFSAVAGGLSDITAIATGGAHTCALLSNGTVQCWGLNGFGALGNGTTNDASNPTQVSGLTDVTAIAAGSATCALLSNGTVHCWGSNQYGQLGSGSFATTELCNNSINCSSIPVPVNGLSGIAVAISAGSRHTCALLSDGTVQCWGINDEGELGNGTTTTTDPYGIPTPVTVTGLHDVIGISAGGSHTCALLSDGTVRCWGSNYFGQLGNGLAAFILTPQPVTALTGVAWSSSNPKVASIDSDGTATAHKAGTITITGASGGYTASTHLTVTAASRPADLVIKRLTATPERKGGQHTFRVTATVSNLGGGTASNFEVDIYKKLSARPVTGQTGNVICLIARLASKASTTCSGRISFSKPGDYKVWAQVDTMNSVSERNEKNNVAFIHVRPRHHRHMDKYPPK